LKARNYPRYPSPALGEGVTPSSVTGGVLFSDSPLLPARAGCLSGKRRDLSKKSDPRGVSPLAGETDLRSKSGEGRKVIIYVSYFPQRRTHPAFVGEDGRFTALPGSSD
jgi:hypothetical protein